MKTHPVLSQTELNNSIRVTNSVVRILRGLVETNVIGRVVGLGDGGGAGGYPDAADGSAAGQVGARGGSLEVGEVGGGGGRRGRVGGGGRRTAAFEVELEEVEEGAGDEGAPDEAASALDDALEGHYQPHGGGFRRGNSGGVPFGFGGGRCGPRDVRGGWDLVGWSLDLATWESESSVILFLHVRQ